MRQRSLFDRLRNLIPAEPTVLRRILNDEEQADYDAYSQDVRGRRWHERLLLIFIWTMLALALAIAIRHLPLLLQAPTTDRAIMTSALIALCLGGALTCCIGIVGATKRLASLDGLPIPEWRFKALHRQGKAPRPERAAEAEAEYHRPEPA